MSLPAPTQPVFYDPAGKRRRHVRRTGWTLSVIVTALMAILIISVLINPLLPRLDLRPVAALPHATDARPQPPPLPAGPRGQKAHYAKTALDRALASTTIVPSRRPSQMRVT